MDNDYRMLFGKGRVSKVLGNLKRSGMPDPEANPAGALLHGHALFMYGDYNRSYRILSAIPSDPAYEAERLWGLSAACLRTGDAVRSHELLDRAFASSPPEWLLPYLFNTLTNAHYFSGRYQESLRSMELGVAAAEKTGDISQQLLLEGNGGIVRSIMGHWDEALTIIERTVKRLMACDNVYHASHFLIVQNQLLQDRNLTAEAMRCLRRAEALVEQSGSVGKLIFLKYELGNLHHRDGNLNREIQALEEALALLKELPDPVFETRINCGLATVYFKKGNLGQALALATRTMEVCLDKGLTAQANFSRMLRGRFLIGSGSTAEGIGELLKCAEQAGAAGSNQIFVSIALYLALGYLNAGDRGLALGWLRRSLDTAERYGLESVYLEERNDIVTALSRLSRDLEFSESLSQLLIRLHHPALLRQLYRFRPPRGKLLFLRALSVHDAPAFLPRVLSYASDQDRSVRHTAKSLLAGWNGHTTYRITTFGSFRVFIENRLLPESVWVRSAVKMLFLFLLNNPGRWLSYDVIMENLWHEADPGSSRKVLINRYSDLRKIIEPWHDRTGKYVFLQSQPGVYGFFPGERIWVDADEFVEQVKLAEGSRLSRGFREARKAYRRAFDLYLGDYLEEFPYQDWLSQRRGHLRDLYFRSAARYAALERDSGNPGEARRVLEEALFRDIGNTECLHLLLEVLQQLKLKAEAREWAVRHAEFMKKELQADVDPEVSAMITG